MKRIFKGLLLCLLVLGVSTSCIKRDDMENINIYTTVYPITYIINSLYGNYSTINSIYPNDIDVNNYEFTEKQLNDFASSSLFIYNGLSNEKEIARKLINKNKNLKIIDVSYGLNIEYSEENPAELWLSPNNYLMLATTVKDNLIDFVTNTYIKEEIDKNYKKIQEEVSLIDAELRSIGSSSKSKNKNTIIVSSDAFKYLENYGFNVISLEDSKNFTNELKNKFKDKVYEYVFIENNKTTDKVDTLVKDYNAKTVSINTMTVLSDEEVKNNENYINITRTFIKNLSDVVL
ncbi:MAG: zinc ABC transporter substrate-binding protein [Bacilli bacterium]|nr:zinc ABC transporter substrate-binding protein [Bacilli bacterium]